MKRLETVLSLVPKSETFVDVGCDHGKLLKSVLDSNLCDFAIGADISAPSLSKAQKLLSSYENVQFILADGILGIDRKIDTVAICGMGGKEIIHIVESGKTNIEIFENWKGKTLILQPQKNVEDVRKFLNDLGFIITADKVAKDNGKYYDVLRAECLEIKNASQSLTAQQIKFGVFYRDKDYLLKEKLILLREKYEGYKQTQEVKENLTCLKEALLWQQ